MERTIPSTESEEVELYVRTYYSLLRSSAEVQIRTLEEVHAGMNSVLHPLARELQPDMSAFIYCLLRLPDCMPQVQLIVLGQSASVFTRGGFNDVFAWQEVSAAARRRRCFFNQKDTLACLIASRSDIDDIIPLLTAFQVEWNKLHLLIRRLPGSFSLEKTCQDVADCDALAEALGIPVEDIERLYAIWDKDFGLNLSRIAEAPRRFRVKLLSGSLSEYRRATHSWWDIIERVVPELRERPVYFVSSNVHSLINLVSGFALHYQDRLVNFLKQSGNTGLLNEWNDIQARRVASSPENFLFYIFKKFIQTPEGRALVEAQKVSDYKHGIVRIPSELYFDVEAQVIDLSQLAPENLDPRLRDEDGSFLSQSNAYIINIDYPLGLAAYNILSEVAENVGGVLGVYVMGKAATLNAKMGDIMIPDVVHDEQSQNTFLFPNCFTAADVVPYLTYGTGLDNQKAVSVRGTFLQNMHYMDVFYREGYTDIEMEAGPYLSAVYEMSRPKRHPVNEIVNLYEIPFDLGILHYASDTPLGKGKNLGAGSLSYYGMDSTYAASIAVLRRIFKVEQKRLANR